jgi:predicted N-acetyltransferase YhbS
MNVDAPFRHRGLGAALVSRYTDDLRRRGIAGVHLFCGADPLPFYARLGFAEVASIALPSGTAVYALARELGSA